MVHKPKHKVHSFRGLLADGGEDEINLERQNVNLAYRIIKFELMPEDPSGSSNESIVKIYKEEQTSPTTLIDFKDTDLLAAAFFSGASGPNYTQDVVVIFDNVLFSRNIFVGHNENSASGSVNYYIELEEVPVTASTLMQLKLGVARKLNLQQD